MRKTRAIVIWMSLWLTAPVQAFAQQDEWATPREVPNVTMGPLVSFAAEGPMRAAIRREGARLAQPPAPVTPQRSWVSQHPVLTGTLIGSGIGAVLSQTDAVGGRNHDPRVTVIGTGGGALTGLVVSAIQKKRANQKLGVGAKIVLVSSVLGAVTLTVLCASYCGGN